MARIPVITSPCPLRWASLPEPGRDHCGQCDRQVHNLDRMTAAQREAFLHGCSGKVCVAYTVQRRAQRRGVALGAGLAAALVGSVAAAADLPIDTSHGPSSAVAGTAVDDDTREIDEIVLTGGIEGGAGNVRWADAADADTATLPEIDASEWLPSQAP